jgi:hypothetical protein
VVRALRLRVAVRTERHAGVVRSLRRHASIGAGMSGLAPAFAPASYEGISRTQPT